MTRSRRALLGQGGVLAASTVIPAALIPALIPALTPGRGLSAPVQTLPETRIEMQGTPRGEHVWFVPAGLALMPGATVRFTNRDAANSHTATSYHPAILDRPLRMPEGAQPWDSGFLMPGDSFAVTLTVPGVYDLYCQPHEAAGMVARLVVGRPRPGESWDAAPDGDLPAAALAAFPPITEILAQGVVQRDRHLHPA